MTGTLEGHWVLDEDSGATAYDYSGNAFHGSISGAGPQGTGTVTGPFGNSAYDFDGSDDYIECGTNSDFTVPRVSAAAWYYSDNTDNYALVSKEAPSGLGASGFHLDTSDFTVIAGGTGDTNGTVANTTEVTGEWTHLVGTYDGSVVRLYRDGALVDSEDHVNGGDITYQSDRNLTIGSVSFQAPADVLNGYMSDPRVYSRALSPQEVQYLYQAGVSSELTMDQI